MADENQEEVQGDAPKTEEQVPQVSDDRDALIQRLQAQLAEVKDEAAQRRISEREQKAQAAKALADKGEFEKALAIHEARVKELEALEPMAQSWQELQAAKAAEVQEQIKGLSPEDQALISKVEGLDAQKALLERLTKSPGPKLNAGAAQGSEKPDSGPELAPEQMNQEQLEAWAAAQVQPRSSGFSMFGRRKARK